MRKSPLKIVILILSCLLLVGAIAGISAVADQADPSITIANKNIAYEGSVQLVYALKVENADGLEPKVIFSEADFHVADGTNISNLGDGYYVKKVHGSIEAGGKTYPLVFSNGIVTKFFRKNVYARPVLVDTDGKIVASDDTVVYSPYIYAMNRFDNVTSSTEQIELYKALLDYGAAVQQVLLNFDGGDISAYGGWADEYYNVTYTDQLTGVSVAYKRGIEVTVPITASKIADGKIFKGFFLGEEQVFASGKSSSAWNQITFKPGSAKKDYVAKYENGVNPYDSLTDASDLPDYVYLTYGNGNVPADPMEDGTYGWFEDGVYKIGKLNSSVQHLIFNPVGTAADKIGANEYKATAFTANAKSVSYEFDIRVDSAENLRPEEKNDSIIFYLHVYSTAEHLTGNYYNRPTAFTHRYKGNAWNFESAWVKTGEWANIRMEFSQHPSLSGYILDVYVNGELVNDYDNDHNRRAVIGSSLPIIALESRYSNASYASDIFYSVDNFRIDYTACDAHDWTNLKHELYKKSGASCIEGTTYYKSCSKCSFAGTETFAADDMIAHRYANIIIDTALKDPASNGIPAIYYQSCEFCGSVNRELPSFTVGEKDSPSEDGNGMRFVASDELTVSSVFSENAATYEAWIRFPKNLDLEGGRGGVILGNYSPAKTRDYETAFSFEIDASGRPKLYYSYSNANAVDESVTIVFDTDVRTGEWLHLAIVNNHENGSVLCYINGEEIKAAPKISATEGHDVNSFAPVTMGAPAVIGNDYRLNEKYRFKGEIHSVAVYNDVRTAEEISSDMEYVGDSGLIAAWKLSDMSKDKLITDVSGNGYHIGDLLGEQFAYNYDAYLAKGFDTVPLTYESWIKFPKDINLSTNRGGVILGNYAEAETASFSFEIDVNGKPCLRYGYLDGNVKSYSFDYDVRTGVWMHLAIVNDYESGRICCYVNGELKDSIEEVWTPPQVSRPAMLGNNYAFSKEYHFKGVLHSVAVYSDVRTAYEIKADMKKDIKNLPTEDLLAAWDLSDIPNGVIEDLSGSGYDVDWMWIKNKAPVENSAYTFAVVGDTQCLNLYQKQNFPKLYNWIIANQKALNIKYVMGLGDITDDDIAREWESAVKAFNKLTAAGIGYSLVRGNHDSSANFNSYLGATSYSTSFDGQFGTTLENTYRKIAVGNIKYLIFALDFGPSDDVLAWASDIIEANKDYNVIITTHAYLYRDGSTLDANEPYPPTRYDKNSNNGDDMWDEFVSKHENIVLVLSGHDPSPSIVCTQTKGDAGNVVTQILSDHQDVDFDLHKSGLPAAGIVTLLHFSEDGKTVTVECYSPIYEMYFRAENNFTFTIDVVE